MPAPPIAQSAVAQSPILPAVGPSPESVRRRQALADAMFQQATQPAPVYSTWEGLARMASAGLAGWQQYEAGRQADKASAAAQNRFAPLIEAILANQGVGSAAAGGAGAPAAGGWNTDPGRAAQPQGDNARTAFNYFVNAGYTPEQASGIVGNLMQESGPGLDPTIYGDGGNAFGIAQWNDRQDNYRGWAAANGRDPNDLQTQLDFITYELGSTETRARDALRVADTPQEAAAAFLGFERPQGFSWADPAGSHGYGNRVANAEAILAQYGITPTEVADAKTKGPQLRQDTRKPDLTTYLGTDPLQLSPPYGQAAGSDLNPIRSTAPGLPIMAQSNPTAQYAQPAQYNGRYGFAPQVPVAQPSPIGGLGTAAAPQPQQAMPAEIGAMGVPGAQDIAAQPYGGLPSPVSSVGLQLSQAGPEPIQAQPSDPTTAKVSPSPNAMPDTFAALDRLGVGQPITPTPAPQLDQVADAGGGRGRSGRSTVTAPSVPSAAPAAPAGGGQDRAKLIAALISAMSDPWLDPGMKQVGGMLLGQMLKQPDPVRGISMGDYLVNPETGEVMADFSRPAATSWQKLDDNTLYDPATGRTQDVGPETADAGAWQKMDDGRLYNTRTGEIRDVGFAGGAGAPPDASGEAALRKEYWERVKSFPEVRRNYEAMQQFAADASGASDVALVYALFKTIDPQSTVREGEFASAASAMGLPDRIIASFTALDNGQFLSPEMRQQIVGVAGQYYDSQAASASQANEYYSGLAQDYGFDPSRIVNGDLLPPPPITPTPAPLPNTAASAVTGGPQPMPKVGEVRPGDDGMYEFLGGDPNDPRSWRKVQ